ncbi:MAG: polyprenyl synthetase family protein [Nitrospiraceae bacterium]|nr:MAG: polyprenyl synthetase family protein [Nitrospiraceae bacterium]
MNLGDYLEAKRRAVDAFLEKNISRGKKQKDCPEHLRESMGYSLMAGGKRLRPILSIASFEAAGGKSDSILPVAASLELVHTYSLIHDDLPSMDNDDFRRNKPTNHKVFGEAVAILAGDGLLADAFNIITHAEADPVRLLQVVRELSHAAGPEGMVGGQTADIVLEGKKAKKKDIVYIHTHKTGALIRGSVRIGAIMAGAPRRKLDSLTEYGEKTGLAFQIIDDILDITGTKEEMGKSTGADSAKGKNTYPSAFGLKKSEKIAGQLIDESLDALKGFDKKADPLREIAKYILLRRN